MASLPARSLGLLAAGAAVLVFLAGTSAHLERACVVLDTPYLPLCEYNEVSAESPHALRARLASNPGDSWAWTRLLVAEQEESPGLLQAATLLAPNHGNVLRRRAAAAMQQGKQQESVDLLVQMLRERRSADAAKALAQLLAASDGPALLRPHLATADAWLPQVLSQMKALNLPSSLALPVVAKALEQRTMPAASRRAYMRQLKADGLWLDAYGLWLVHRKELIPLLYNGGFDQRIEPDGFDWEFSETSRSRAGVVIQQQAFARRGLVLDLDFTGRTFRRPIARQYLFVPPGSYRLRGEYMAQRLRSEAGLEWQVVCPGGQQARVDATTRLTDTGGVWKPWQMDFQVPPECGPVASLQLEPAAAYEARTGIRGRVALDSVSLVRSAP
jgi:hypothetical protein